MAISPKQREALEIVAAGRFVPSLVREADGWHARWLAIQGEENRWVDEVVRRATMTALSEDAENQQHETLHDAWLMALRSRTGLVRGDDAACEAFAETLRQWAAPAWPVPEDARTVFRFSEESDGSFAVTCPVPKGLVAYRLLGEAIVFFGPLRGMRRAPDGTLRAILDQAEAESFLRSGARRLREAGYRVEGVDLTADIKLDAEVVETDAKGAGSADAPGGVALRLKVRVAGEYASEAEIRFLLEQGTSLVFFRNRWIEVDRNLLREALRALERANGRKLSASEAMRFAQGLGAIGKVEIDDVRAHGWLRGLVHELRSKGVFKGLEICMRPAGFQGDLRQYQARGVAWMKFLTDHGFGALLADEMGLGKTVQTIAWLCLHVAGREAGACAPVLVVAPLTLLGNWRRELSTFAPQLKVYVHHGDMRHLASGFRRAALASHVVLTSYTLLVREYSDFSSVAWDAVIIDEAQTIKNADTRAARAVKALGAHKRIALTGTPVENDVSDLWSLEAFLNPGFLPERQDFRERFERPIAADPHAMAAKRLRHALEPFMLRRLKSMAQVATELGEKREIREYCELTPRERDAYETALAIWRGSERERGDIFALITRLKLVCDGLVDDTPIRQEESGKLARLVDLLDAIFAAGESALVFTQYAKVGAMLKDALEARFPSRVNFLHGGLSAPAREREIASFNEPGAKAFILSLRAGGFGLNLVKATHVIHFDRWWNPAVEAQATDRAHRIGQTLTVMVHLFVTSGTIEDRVDAILARKRDLGGSLIVNGEQFLATLSRGQFEEVVALESENSV